MSELKKLTPKGVERALRKIERYRLLNEPAEAESICRDVLEVDPTNQDALIDLTLSLTDQFGTGGQGAVTEAQGLLERLASDYHREYYAGIICERRGSALLRRGTPGAGPVVYEWYRRAMEHYDKAEPLRPDGNDDSLVRWNTCFRLIERHGLAAASATRTRTLLE